MLDGFKMGGLKDLNWLSGHIIGTVVVILVAGVAIAATCWVLGKVLQSKKWAGGGFTALGLSLVGAMVLGSWSGGVESTSGDLTTKKMMIKDARPRNITVHKKAPSTRCINAVTWEHAGFSTEVDTFDKDQHKPSEADHKIGVNILDNLGAWDWQVKKPDKPSTSKAGWIKKLRAKNMKGNWWYGASPELTKGSWKHLDKVVKGGGTSTNPRNRPKSASWKVAKVSWYPKTVDNDGDCTANNKHAGANTDVVVWIWVKPDNGKGHGHAGFWQYEFDSGKDPNTTDIKPGDKGGKKDNGGKGHKGGKDNKPRRCYNRVC